ncbi:diguanylate cyclase [uncultured Methylophaga sp.]|uniref:diguanylate cyclase n=1 Tax=uncultured Methylophaga sp. TaxID=285271 RepID=UPI0030D96550|tara:strand:+ start:456 stop:1820 length:1365 start_codon:yes stop_codon:yes gene_type:complete
MAGHISANAEVVLTKEEQAYLTQKQVIELCVDPDWLPYEGIDEKGKFTGIMSDFYDLWSDKINKPIQLVNTTNWEQSLQFIQDGKCDILASAQDVPSRREWLNVSKPFIFYPLAVATQPDRQFVVKFEQIQHRDFVMVEGYAGVELLRNRYPDINITTVNTSREGLKMVETGTAYGFIDTVPTINYQMLRWGISHLKISNVLELQYAMSVGVSTREPQLLKIFNKAIDDTSEVERQRVLNNWLSIDFQQHNTVLFWQLLVGVSLVLLVLVYRYRQVHHHNRNLRNLNNQLEQISRYDHLTGLANRYALHERFNEEIETSSQTKQIFSLILLDVDFFKTINDDYGHDVGDEVIKQFASLLMSMVRENDMVGRWGGEEFLILCSQTTKNGAFQLADQLRRQVQSYNFPVNQQITASFGLSEYRHGETIGDTIKRADDALYKAKRNGRNQIVMADSD